MIENPKKPVVCTDANQKLRQGLTLVPYWAYDERGKLTNYCKWVKLRRGESIAQAAQRLNVTPPEPHWTPELKTKVAQILREIALGSDDNLPRQ